MTLVVVAVLDLAGLFRRPSSSTPSAGAAGAFAAPTRP